MKRILTKASVFLLALTVFMGVTSFDAHAVAGLRINATITPDTATVGDTVELHYDVTNPYDGTVGNVTLIRSDPTFFSQVEFVPDSVKLNGVTVTNFTFTSNSSLTLNMGDIEAGETSTITFKVKILSQGEIDEPRGSYRFTDPSGERKTMIGGGSSVTINSKYKLNYDANEGTGTAPEPQLYSKGETITAAENMFTAPEGKIFKEWNTQADGEGQGYSKGDQFAGPAANMTLYAIWKTDDTPTKESTQETESTGQDEKNDPDSTKSSSSAKGKEDAKGNSPSTGDDMNMALFLVLAAVAGGTLIFLGRKSFMKK